MWPRTWLCCRSKYNIFACVMTFNILWFMVRPTLGCGYRCHCRRARGRVRLAHKLLAHKRVACIRARVRGVAPAQRTQRCVPAGPRLVALTALARERRVVRCMVLQSRALSQAVAGEATDAGHYIYLLL